MGRNSFSGGSSSRIVTGYPFISRYSSLKSSRCMGRSRASAASRSSFVPARIISCMMGMRSSAKNMCWVRHSPIPSAPKSRATRASRGVSALARTFSRRTASPHDRTIAEGGRSSWERISGTFPRITSPVAPFSVISSPSRRSRPPAMKRFVASSTSIDSHPVTHVFPIWRATTAAWEVIPPFAVRIPRAASIPWMSSGLVSRRTRITSRPAMARSTALSAEKTIAPVAAPGEAGSPVAITSTAASGSTTG